MSEEYYGARESSRRGEVIFGGLFDHLLEKPRTDQIPWPPRPSRKAGVVEDEANEHCK